MQPARVALYRRVPGAATARIRDVNPGRVPRSEPPLVPDQGAGSLLCLANEYQAAGLLGSCEVVDLSGEVAPVYPLVGGKERELGMMARGGCHCRRRSCWKLASGAGVYLTPGRSRKNSRMVQLAEVFPASCRR